MKFNINKKLILVCGIIFVLLTNVNATTLTISNKTTMLCGEVTGYDNIYITGTGQLNICIFNGTIGGGYLNISLGDNGNFTLASGGVINGSGSGGRGGGAASANCGTSGDNGNNWTAGVSASCIANGGGGGGGSDGGSTAESGAGGGGAFGGAGGKGGKSIAASTQGASGIVYGATTGVNSTQLKTGSGGGGQGGDAQASTGIGKGGGGGIKIDAGNGIIDIHGQINMTGVQGTAGDTTDDSGGGSGSGGHVILIAKTLNLSSGVIDANGAAGGDAGNSVTSDSCGGGGGGGGRILYIYQTIEQTSLVNQSFGGLWGITIDAGCNQTNVTNGFPPTAGGNGTVTYSPDTTYPIFSNYWDDNATLTGTGTGLFNVTLTSTNGTVFFEINGNNITAKNITANVYNASYAFTSAGNYSYKWHSWSNETVHLFNTSETKIYTVNATDTIYPWFANYSTTPSNNTAYALNAYYNFSSNINLTNGSSGIEFNSVNYTAFNSTGNLFNATLYNQPAGSYTYYWWAYGNGASHLFNNSDIRDYTIARATGTVNLTINVTTPQNYGTKINATCEVKNGDDTNATLRVDGALKTSGTILDLNASTHTINCSKIISQNYTASENVSSFVINQIASAVNLTINVTTPQNYGIKINATCGLLIGEGGNVTLWVDGVNKALGVTLDLNASTHTMNCSYVATTNYTGSNNYSSFVINQIASAINLTVNETANNISIYQNGQIYLNVSKLTGDADAILELYNNGTLINNGSSNLSNLTTFATAGTFNITGHYNATTNYSQSWQTWNVSVIAVADSTPPYFNEVLTNQTVAYKTAFGLDVNATDAVGFDSYAVNDTTNFNINSSGWLKNATSLAVGTYRINITINDTTNNKNTSNIQLTVTSLASAVNLTINATTPQNYGIKINATCGVLTGDNSNATLWVDGVNKALGVTLDLNASTHTMNCSYIATTNYTGSNNYSSFVINQIASAINLTVNETQNNISINEGGSIYLNVSLLTGELPNYVELYKDSVLLNNGSSPLSNLTAFNSLGTFNITGHYNATTNYSQSWQTWNVSVNDVDAEYPQFSNYWDNNATLTGSGTGLFNVTLTSTNGTVILDINNTNITATNLTVNIYNASYSFASAGNYTYRWYAYGNGTNHNFNISQVKNYTVNASAVDTEYPQFSNYSTTPANNTAYALNAYYNFSANVNITNGSVGLVFNGINQSVFNTTGNLFNATLYNQPAGSYTYYWWAYGNGTSHNYNTSGTRDYTIARATGTVNLTINVTTPQNYGTKINATCEVKNGDDTNATLRVDGLLKTSGTILDLNASTHTINCSKIISQNYTASENVSSFVINQIASAINLTVNNTANNISIYQNGQIYLNVSRLTGDLGAILELYNNGTLINNGSSPLSNLTTFSTIGTFNITGHYNATTNYSQSWQTWNVTVIAPSDTIKPNLTIFYPENITYHNFTLLNLNYTAFDETSLDSVWYYINNATTNVTRNITISSNTTFNLPEGSYILYLFANDSSNNINASRNISFTINNSQIIPIYTKFKGQGSTTILEGNSNLQLESISNLILESSTYGKMQFNENVNLTANVSSSSNRSSLDDNVNISYNRIFVNSTGLSGLNVNTKLSLYNLTFTDPRVLKDGAVCSDCVEESYFGRNFVFNVTGFSVYSAEETPTGAGGNNVGGGTGGGGGSTKKILNETKECFTNWTCNSWSFCSVDITQTRICYKEQENCTAGEKPIEFRSCPDILFDVKVNILNPLIIFKDNLKFSVDLKEINNSDLVDIEIFYIILKNGEEIYKEKETKAIKEPLIYQKELNNLDLPAGTYELQVIVNYGKNQTAGALHQFKILGPKGFILPLIIFLVLIFLGISGYNVRKVRKEEEEIKEYLSKIDFSEIEKKRQFYQPVFKQKEVEEEYYKPAFKPKESSKEADELSLDEIKKGILTLVNGIQKDSAIPFIQKYLRYSEKAIEEVINALHKEGLLETIIFPDDENKVNWYFHTPKVKPEMVDDSIRFKETFGWDYKEVSDKPIYSEKEMVDDSIRFKETFGWDYKEVSDKPIYPEKEKEVKENYDSLLKTKNQEETKKQIVDRLIEEVKANGEEENQPEKKEDNSKTEN